MNCDLGQWWVTFKLAGQVFGEMSDELQRLEYPGFGVAGNRLTSLSR